MSIARCMFALLAVAAFSSLQSATAQQSTGRQATQDDRRNNAQDQATDEQSDQYQARRAATGSHQQGSVSLTEAIVRKVQMVNKAEIELAKLAEQKSANQEVQQLAKSIIQDHQTLTKKLRQLQSQSESSARLNREQRDQDDRQPNPIALQKRTRNTDSATVPQQLCKIIDQAGQNALKMNKQMLNNYKGQDFDMAFLGQQIVIHTIVLAELKAIQSTGPQELQPIAGEAASKVQMHLEKAKQLAKKLADESGSRG